MRSLNNEEKPQSWFNQKLLIMATRFSMGDSLIESRPKKTRQGKGKHSKYSATSRNGAKKRYRGQGR